jgi:pimeloyl-[acyl-carrier protein] methyl ester esterase
MTDLYVQQVGEGPDLVFLHGWGMHSGVWDDVVEALVDDYRITLIDLPGHGYSRFAFQGSLQQSRSRVEEDSLTYLDANDETPLTLRGLSHQIAVNAPAKAIWIGWSLGGLIAQRLAIDAPTRVSKLVLVSASPCFVRRPDWPWAVDYRVLRQFAENLSLDYRGTLKRFLALEVHGGEHEVAQLRALRGLVFQHGDPDPDWLRAGLKFLESEDLRSELSDIQCPTLLLMGRRDNLVPASAGTAVQRLLPNARLQVFAGAAHAPFFSHSHEFMRHLQVFIHE